MDQPNVLSNTPAKRPKILLIGNFDGVHRGHQALINQALKAARDVSGEAFVLTFDPHPSQVLAPERASPLLVTLERKCELLAEAGVRQTIIQPFDIAFATKQPRAFVEEVIVPLGVQHIFVGADFCFGDKRSGTFQTLVELGLELGYIAHSAELAQQQGAIVSSSRIRQALATGDVAAAKELLGRPFDFDGLVVHGHQRGRTLGFPTANLVSQTGGVLQTGVYAVRVRYENDGEITVAEGVMNIGTRPTIEITGTPTRSIEVHLLDTNRDLYGKTLRVACVERIRDEQKFENLEALRAQIQRDTETTRDALSSL